MNPRMNGKFKQSTIGAMVALALGASATSTADIYQFTFSAGTYDAPNFTFTNAGTWNVGLGVFEAPWNGGVFTMITGADAVLQNTSFNSSYTWYGYRTPISGTLTYNDATRTGTMTVGAFDFNNQVNPPPATAQNVTFQAIGDGAGGIGPLWLGNMTFDWNSTIGIPVSIVWDATGILNAINAGLVNGNTVTGGATPASSGKICGSGGSAFACPIGAAPLATTGWNTTTVPGTVLTTNPSGTLPLIANVISGSPMQTAPFAGFNANFDVMKLTVANVTLGVDTTPTVFTLPDTAPLESTSTSSNTVTVAEIDTTTAISIAGVGTSEYRIDGGAWTAAAGFIRNSQTVQVRHDTVAGAGNTTTSNLTIGTLTVPFSTVNSGPDITPAAFSFTTQTGVAISTVIDSNIITPTGFNTPTAITVANGSYQIDGAGGFVTGAGTLNPGETVQVRHTSVGTFNTTGTTTLTIGGVAGTFSTTTALSDTTPDAFTFAAQSGVSPSATITSNTITVAGINDPSTPISVTGGSYSINGGAYTTAPGTVANGQTVTVRHTSSNSSVTAVSTVLNIGGVTSTLTSTTSAANAVAFTSAFTMLDTAGSNVGRDTAVTGTYDYTTNTSSTGTNFNMTLQSVVPFFGNTWTAHDIRVFGPGTYTVNSACTAAEIRANGGATCAASGPALTFTVNAGQLGAHILFDWNNNNDIDVAQVWNTDYSASAVPASAGTVYKYSTQDGNGDGIAGFPMVAGPFIGFNANFDIKFSNYTGVTASVGTVGALVELAAPSSGMPANFTAGSGAVQFDVTGVGAGGSTTIVVSAPNLKANDKAYWIDGNGVYHEITSARNVVYDYNAKTVSYMVTDNGFGDTDGLQNGSISDPFVLLTPVSQLGSSSGGGGGGCAMGGSAFDPVLPGSLMAALAWLGWRRRKGE